MTSGLRLCCVINGNRISGAWASSEEDTGGSEESPLRTREDAGRRRKRKQVAEKTPRHCRREAACPPFSICKDRQRGEVTPQPTVVRTLGPLLLCAQPHETRSFGKLELPGACFLQGSAAPTLQQGAVQHSGRARDPWGRRALGHPVIAWRSTARSLCT